MGVVPYTLKNAFIHLPYAGKWKVKCYGNVHWFPPTA